MYTEKHSGRTSEKICITTLENSSFLFCFLKTIPSCLLLKRFNVSLNRLNAEINLLFAWVKNEQIKQNFKCGQSICFYCQWIWTLTPQFTDYTVPWDTCLHQVSLVQLVEVAVAQVVVTEEYQLSCWFSSLAYLVHCQLLWLIGHPVSFLDWLVSLAMLGLAQDHLLQTLLLDRGAVTQASLHFKVTDNL